MFQVSKKHIEVPGKENKATLSELEENTIYWVEVATLKNGIEVSKSGKANGQTESKISFVLITERTQCNTMVWFHQNFNQLH